MCREGFVPVHVLFPASRNSSVDVAPRRSSLAAAEDTTTRGKEKKLAQDTGDEDPQQGGHEGERVNRAKNKTGEAKERRRTRIIVEEGSNNNK